MPLFSRARGDLSVIFDIGPQNIGAAIVLQKDSEKPLIIWTHRESFTDEKERPARELLEAMLSTLKKINGASLKDAVAELHGKGFSVPSSIWYVLSSPWVELNQKTVTVTYKSPTTITPKLVSNILDQEKTSFESSGLVLIDKTVTGLKVNGYSLENPYGKKAFSLEVSFTLTVTPKELIDRVEESVSTRKAHVRAFSTATYVALKHLFDKKDFLSLTIENNVTELVLAKDNAMRLHTSIFSGSNALTDAVAKEFGISFQEAYSLVHLSFNKHMDKATTDKVAEAVKKERLRWREELETSIKNTGEAVSLPHISFFVISDVGFVADILKDQDVSGFGIPRTALDPVIVNSETLKDTVMFADASHADVRIGLIVLSLGISSASSSQ